MASNNFISANITPSSDTFREWVDLTNRITFDMEKVVVTTLNSATGGGTTGNAYVNGFFSANTLMVATNLTGANPDDSGDFGTKAATADLTISSNTVQQGNLVAQANVTLSGMNVVTSSNVEINATSTTFTSNAGTNIFNTPLDINANMDVDNTLTDITSTNTSINNGELNIGSNLVVNSTSTNANIAANVALSGANVYITSTNVNITSAGITLGDASSDILTVKANTTLNDELNVKGDVDFDSNLNLDGSAVIDVNLTVAGTTKLDGPTDINANMDVDNALTDITSTNLAVTGTNTTISSNLAIIGNTTQMFGNNVFIGNANTDTLNVASNTFLLDTLDVAEATNLQKTLTVGGATTLNGTSDINGNMDIDASSVTIDGGTLTVGSNTILNDELTVTKEATFNGDVILGDASSDTLAIQSKVTTDILPSANGSKNIGSVAERFNVIANDLVGEDITSNNTLSVTGQTNLSANLNVTEAANVAGNVTLGSATSDVIQVLGLVNTHIIPDTSGRNLGSNAKRWDAILQTANTTGNLDVGGDATVVGETESATLKITGTSLQTGLVTMGGGADITGALDVTSSVSVSSGGNLVEISANNLTIGSSTSNTAITSDTIATDGSLLVTTTSNLKGDVTAEGDVTISQNAISTGVETGTIHATGAVDFDSTLDVDGETKLNGHVVLGNATGDKVQFKGQSNTNLVPATNDERQLGLASKRWKGVFSTANTSTSLQVGTSATIGTFAAVGGTLGVNNTITVSNGALVAFPGSGTERKMVEFGNSSSNAQISANSSGINIVTGTGKITAKTLEITDAAVLPSDTTLSASSLSATDLTITNKATFTGTGSDKALVLGDGSNIVTLDMNKAIVNSHFISANTDQDIGADGTRWGEGHFESLLQVGGSAGIVLSDSGGSSTANVTADNIIARDELVGASTSDQQLKDKVIKIDTAMNKVELINGYEFVWNDNIGDYRSGTPDYGIIAQEIENVLPHAVDINSRGYKTVNYNSLIPLLIEAVKELSARVKELEPDPEPEEDIDG